MQDHKTVREALDTLDMNAIKVEPRDAFIQIELTLNQYENLRKVLTALDRIEAVETVTVKQACDMGIDSMDASFIMEKYPNGLRIVKEK